jgi:outer membrane protein assembly factor BamB
LDPTTGATASTLTLSGAAASFSPVVADGTVLMVTEDGKLTAWR